MLEKALETLKNHPFLFLLSEAKYVLTVLDKTGRILWLFNPLNQHQHSEAIHFLNGKNIRDFYVIKEREDFSNHPDIKDIKHLEDYYRRCDLARCQSAIMEFPWFRSKNIYENRFYRFNITTSLPVSTIRIMKIMPGFFLGIISLNSPIKDLSRWNEDANLLLDAENRLVGYDDNFLRLLKDGKPALGAPLDRYILTDFLKQVPTPLHAKRDGKVLFSFTGNHGDRGELHPRDCFSISPEGLHCSTEKGLVPAFLKLPERFDFEQHDFTLDITAGNIKHEPPICILNGDEPEPGIFPDEHGLLFGPLYIPGRKPGLKQQVSFLLKREGMIVTVFNNFSLPGFRTEDGLSYSIQKQADVFYFSVNGVAIGSLPAEGLSFPPESRYILAGLRPGNACLFSSISLVQYPKSPPLPELASRTTCFHNRPQDKFRATSSYFYMETPESARGFIHYLRLEDLKAKEKINLLTRKTREQEVEIERLKKGIFGAAGLERIIGESVGMDKMRKTLAMVTQSTVPILLTGETGTGKSMIAQAVHETSGRNKGPFVKVDCSNLPDSLIESELFGFEKGAFTGAHAQYKGKFEQADGGTIFLDEISNITPNVQAKLLTVLHDLTIIRIGGQKPVPLDIRIISASNRDLEDMVAQGKFRSDLYYRLNALHLLVPPLRERPDDIPMLCDHFLKTELYRHNPGVKTIGPAVYRKLMRYSWPGNIRELYNVLLKAVVFCGGGELKPEDIQLPATARDPGNSVPAEANRGPSGRKAKSRVTLQRVLDEVKACDGNIRWAAENLNIARLTVYKKLQKAGMDPGKLRKI
jgi:DNA-binding NtrC family response regulator